VAGRLIASYIVGMRRAALTLLLVAPLGGCAHGGRTYVFETDRPQDESLDIVARTLEQQGHPVSRRDRSGGELVTLWQDTGEREAGGSLGPQAALFVRHHVYLRTFGDDHQVRLAMETQRCAPEGLTVTASEVIGRCEPGGHPPAQQQKTVEQLGAALAAALGPPVHLSSGSAASDASSLALAVPPDQAVRALSRALADEGLDCVVADPVGGALATRWRDSGYRIQTAETGDDYLAFPSLVLRRYLLTVERAGTGSEVHLRVDARRCEPPFRADLSVGCQDADQARTQLRRDLSSLSRRLAARTGAALRGG
jgi:hypothetical protein